LTDSLVQGLKNWLRLQAEKEAKNDVLKKSDRIGNIIGFVGGIIVLIFFIVHSTSQTGFFTSGFGLVEAILFFGITGWGLIPVLVRFMAGKKSMAKPLDIIGMFLIFIAMIYFLATFPFDFSHFADPLPGALEWIIQWITNDIARALMILGTIAMVFLIPWQTVDYLYLRRELAKIPAAPQADAVPSPNQEAPKQ